jgi:hypothetical protein
MILYTPPTIWGLLRGAAINLLLPFINGLMLGFGELFAHEAAFRLGWGGTKVCGPFISLQGLLGLEERRKMILSPGLLGLWALVLFGHLLRSLFVTGNS